MLAIIMVGVPSRRISVNYPNITYDENTVKLCARQDHVQWANSTKELLLWIPLKVSVTATKYDAIQIKAKPIGRDSDITFRAFRGAFLSKVADNYCDFSAVKYLRTETYDSKVSNQTNATVNTNEWIESARPRIEFRPSPTSSSNRLSGTTELDFICVFPHTEWDKAFPFDAVQIQLTLVGILNLEEEEIDHLILDFSREDGPNNHNVSIKGDSTLIEKYYDEDNQTVYNFKGPGYSVHPKQLLTAECLRNLLKEVQSGTLKLPSSLTIGYVGIDTGENFHSVLRTIEQFDDSKLVEKIIIYYHEAWDEPFRKTFIRSLSDNPIPIKWKEISDNGKKDKNWQSDIIISTYVLPWALNLDKSRQQEYLKEIFSNLKESGMILSVDPRSHKYVARSAGSLNSGVNVKNSLRNAHFKELPNTEEFVVNDCKICEASLWSMKGFVEEKISDDEYTRAATEKKRTEIEDDAYITRMMND